MSKPSPVFVIPTYRLREVGQTVEAYDDQFRHNGHALDLIVFDDSSVANQEKYYQLLEKTRTFNPLYYVGPQEKEQFLNYLFGRLRDRKLEPLVRNLFRPSYGGNRNYTLMYTLGDLLISADDDMHLCRTSVYIEVSGSSGVQTSRSQLSAACWVSRLFL